MSLFSAVHCEYALACVLVVFDITVRGCLDPLRWYIVRQLVMSADDYLVRDREDVRAQLGAGIQDTHRRCAVLPLLSKAVNRDTSQTKSRFITESLIEKNWVKSCGCQFNSWQTTWAKNISNKACSTSAGLLWTATSYSHSWRYQYYLLSSCVGFSHHPSKQLDLATGGVWILLN